MYLKVRGRNAQTHTGACVLAKENRAAQRSKLGCTQRTRYSATEKNTLLMLTALQQMTKERKKRKARSEAVNCKFFCVEGSEKGKLVNGGRGQVKRHGVETFSQ